MDNICKLILGFGVPQKNLPRSTRMAGTVQTTCNNPSKPRPFEFVLQYSSSKYVSY